MPYKNIYMGIENASILFLILESDINSLLINK